MAADLLPDDAWVNSFQHSAPKPLLASLKTRLQRSAQTQDAIADLFKERAAVEHAYAQGLAKALKKIESASVGAGGEKLVWDGLISEMQETSSAHSTFAAILRTDFEQPMRELPSKLPAWQRIGQQDQSLEKTMKSWESAQTKLQKASKKGGPKQQAAQADVEELQSSLASLSPLVFTTYQKVDETRLAALKETAVRYGTTLAEITAKKGERAERQVGQLLTWDTRAECESIALSLAGTGGGGGRTSGGPPTLSSVRTPSRRASIVTQNSTSDFAPPSQSQTQMPSTPNRQTYDQSTVQSTTPSSFTGNFKSLLSRKQSTTNGPGRDRSSSNATARSGRGGSIAPATGFETLGEEVPKSAPNVDDEGFSVAPADRHRNPWEDPDELVPTRANGSGPSEMLRADSPDSMQQPIQPKLNMSLAPLPIQETEEEKQAALQMMQSKLLAGGPQAPTRRSTIARGRRDVRNTTFMQAGDDVPLALAMGGLRTGSVQEEPSQSDSPAASSPRPSLNPFDSPSVGALSPFATGQATKAPSTGSGLRATINETVNAIIKGGVVQRAMITGEIALSLVHNAGMPAPGPIHLRLTEFEQLEKVAPNPAFLAQVPDRPGEYLLNSDMLAAKSGQVQLLLKYQLHVQPGKESDFIPIDVQPSWRCKDGEARLVLPYRANQSSKLWSQSNALSDISFVAGFQGPAVTSVQAKPPGGVWSPANRKIEWTIPGLDSTSSDGKILARFITVEGEAPRPEPVHVKWRAEGALSSQIGIETVTSEGAEWVFEDVKKAVGSGKYVAE